MKRTKLLNRYKILSIMDRLDFFQQFRQSERDIFIDSHSQFVVCDEGEYIIQQGAKDTAFYILLSGTVTVTTNTDIEEKTLAVLQPGEFFGETTFLTNTPRTSNVIANENCILFRVDKQLMRTLGPQVREKIKDKIIEKLISRLSAMNQALAEQEG